MSLLPLRKGARIGIFSPSGPPDPEGLSAGMALLAGWGYEPVAGPHALSRERYLAGTDAERLADLEWALSAPDLDAAWMSRGGYGLARLLPLLDWSRVRPRPVLGFSDGTALLVALRRRGLAGGIHAPVVRSLASLPDADSLVALRRLLESGAGDAWPGRTVRGGTAAGPLVGGNLTVLGSLAGTPEALDAQGAILLLEDVGERPYRLDRTITQLRQAGTFDGIAGLALGQFVRCDDDPERDGPAADALAAVLADLSVPILADLPVGHDHGNRPFVYGARAALADGRLAVGGEAGGG